MIPGAIAHLVEPAVAAVFESMSAQALLDLRRLEAVNGSLEQVPIATYHVLHGGMYARTITIPAGVVLTGALIKIPTLVILNGDATVAIGRSGDRAEGVRLTGYHVIPASENRKQAFIAHADTQLTMIFPTSAKDVDTAEREFTDEHERLFSRGGLNVVHNTGVPA